MTMIKKVPALGIGLLAVCSLAASNQPSLKNPGAWKSLPYSLVKGEEEGTAKAFRLKNNDLFDKICQVQVARQKIAIPDEDDPTQSSPEKPTKKLKPFYDETIVIKAQRAIEIALDEKYQDITLAEVVANAGCVHLPEGKKPDDIKLPTDVSCKVNDASCEQICAADAADADKCENNHLLLGFARDSWKATFDKVKGATLSGEFTNNAKNDLYCQVVTIVKGVNDSTGDIVYVTAPTAPKAFKVGEATTVEWGLEVSELVNSNNIEASRPRIVAACSTEEISKDYWKSCDPLKRTECNWVVAH